MPLQLLNERLVQFLKLQWKADAWKQESLPNNFLIMCKFPGNWFLVLSFTTCQNTFIVRYFLPFCFVSTFGKWLSNQHCFEKNPFNIGNLFEAQSENILLHCVGWALHKK